MKIGKANMMRILLCVSVLPLMTRAQSAVRFDPKSIMSNDEASLTDTSVDTCATFSTISTRATKLRYATSCPNTTLHVTIKGTNLGCGKSLFVSPIAEAESGTWTGRWSTCQLEWSGIDPHGKEWCAHRCICPATGCMDIQLVKKPRPGEDSSWTLCTLFDQCNAPVTNLAQNPADHCTASSVSFLGFECDRAFDGKTDPSYDVIVGASVWASVGGINEWIQLDFPMTVLLTHVIVWHPCWIDEQYQSLLFTLSDGTNIQATHVCYGSNDWTNCNAHRWTRYELWPSRLTTSVRLTGNDDCAPLKEHNGFIELEYYGIQV